MEQLLKITVIPTEYELKTEPARIERSPSGPPVVEIHRERGGLEISRTPAHLNLDTSRARRSLIPTTGDVIYQAAQKGKKAAADLAQSYAAETAQMLWSKPGEGGEMISRIISQRMQCPKGDFQLTFLPTGGVDITYEPGTLEIHYEMDKLTFELRVNNGETEYIPGSFEMIITQYPDVLIEYMGEPMYVPPSAVEYFTGGRLDETA